MNYNPVREKMPDQSMFYVSPELQQKVREAIAAVFECMATHSQRMAEQMGEFQAMDAANKSRLEQGARQIRRPIF